MQCNVYNLKKNTHKVLRAFCLPSVHLINSSPFFFIVFTIEKKKIISSNSIPG